MEAKMKHFQSAALECRIKLRGGENIMSFIWKRLGCKIKYLLC